MSFPVWVTRVLRAQHHSVWAPTAIYIPKLVDARHMEPWPTQEAALLHRWIHDGPTSQKRKHPDLCSDQSSADFICDWSSPITDVEFTITYKGAAPVIPDSWPRGIFSFNYLETTRSDCVVPRSGTNQCRSLVLVYFCVQKAAFDRHPSCENYYV